MRSARDGKHAMPASMSRDKKTIVVLGGGFGGVYAAKQLCSIAKKRGDLRVVLVNRTNYFLFTPLLHEVATGGVTPEAVVEPLQKALDSRFVDFIFDTVESISFKKKRISFAKEGILTYDALILALGAETNYYNTPGAEDFCFPLKTLPDAVRIKNTLIDIFYRASRTHDPEERRRLLCFTIIGGGPTGVEVAAELSEFIEHTFTRVYRARQIAKDARVTLIHHGSELLERFPPYFRERAQKQLVRHNISIRLNTSATKVDSNGVSLSDGSYIPSELVLWTAGVKPSAVPLASGESCAHDRRGCIMVDQYLRVASQREVFAIGDIAHFANEGSGEQAPALAQTAVMQAPAAAHNAVSELFKRPLAPFIFKQRGSLVSLGQWMAVGEVSKLRFSGHMAWLLWRSVYLTKIISWRKRLRVMLDWFLDFFDYRDISRL